MKTLSPLLTLATASLMAACSAQPVVAEQAPAFALTKIAEADNVTVSLWETAAINDRGQVGYGLLRLDDLTTTIAVADRQASSVVLTMSPYFFGWVVALSDSGRLGLLIDEYNVDTFEVLGSRFAVALDGQFQPIVDLPAPPQLFAPYISQAFINNGGTAAFTITDFVEDIRSTVYTSQGSALTVVAQGSPEGVGNPIHLALNNSNAVAYSKWEGPREDRGKYPAVFVWQDGVATRVIDSSVFLPEEAGEFGNRYFQGLAMNDRGTIAVGTGRRIVTWDRGTLTTIAQTGPTFLVGHVDGMNNRGQVVFDGAEDPDGDGTAPGSLYVGDSNRVQRILGAQDRLWGKTVEYIRADSAINARGQVVFPVQFTDGSSAIVLASPPELRLTIARRGDMLHLTATGTPNTNWRIESRDSATGPSTGSGQAPDAWQPLTTITLGPNPTVIQQPIDGTNRFYRGAWLP